MAGRRTHFKRFRNAILAHLAAYVIRVLLWTVRFRFEGLDEARNASLRTDGGILAFWHDGIMLLLGHRISGASKVAISAGSDGEFAVRIVRHFGVGAVRGSSGRDGARLLRQFASEEHPLLGVTPDGPRGPRHVAQAGTVWIAAKTGLPVVPVGVAANRVWHLRSWDRFQIPKPFARCAIHFGPSLTLGPAVDRATVEADRLRLEEALKDVSLAAARAIGGPDAG